MSFLRFESPWLLLLLLLVPLIAWLRGRHGRAAALRYSSVALLAGLGGVHRARSGGWLFFLRLLAISLLILALARPQWGEGESTTESSGVDIMLAIDLSTSMWAHDFEVRGRPTDRLTAVKNVVRTFIEARPDDRIGMVAFAGEAYLVSPLTLNHDWLQRQLDRLEIGLIEDGTAIGSAITVLTNRLRDLEAESRVAILLTDGANTAGEIEPDIAAEAAAAYGIRIHTVGAGREGIVPTPRLGRDAKPIRDRQGNLLMARGISQLDHESLKTVAETTGGTFFRAENTDALEEVYERIDQMEKREVEITYEVAYTEMYAWFALAGLLGLLFEWLAAHAARPSLP